MSYKYEIVRLVFVMHSQSSLPGVGIKERLIRFTNRKLDDLTDRQKTFLKKAWGILTYKWRWQIAMNVPYLLIFLLDRTIPAVHEFDMALLSVITSKFPLPASLLSVMGLGNFH